MVLSTFVFLSCISWNRIGFPVLNKFISVWKFGCATKPRWQIHSLLTLPHPLPPAVEKVSFQPNETLLLAKWYKIFTESVKKTCFYMCDKGKNFPIQFLSFFHGKKILLFLLNTNSFWSLSSNETKLFIVN